MSSPSPGTTPTNQGAPTTPAVSALSAVVPIASLAHEDQRRFYLALTEYTYMTEDQIDALIQVFGSDLMFIFTLLSGETIRFPSAKELRAVVKDILPDADVS